MVDLRKFRIGSMATHRHGAVIQVTRVWTLAGIHPLFDAETAIEGVVLVDDPFAPPVWKWGATVATFSRGLNPVRP